MSGARPAARVVVSAGAPRCLALAGALLCGGLGLGGCHGPPVAVTPDGTGGGGGARPDGGDAHGAGGDSGPPLPPLTVVPGTGLPGFVTPNLSMMVFDSGTVYVTIYDVTDGKIVRQLDIQVTDPE